MPFFSASENSGNLFFHSQRVDTEQPIFSAICLSLRPSLAHPRSSVSPSGSSHCSYLPLRPIGTHLQILSTRLPTSLYSTAPSKREMPSPAATHTAFRRKGEPYTMDSSAPTTTPLNTVPNRTVGATLPLLRAHTFRAGVHGFRGDHTRVVLVWNQICDRHFQQFFLNHLRTSLQNKNRPETRTVKISNVPPAGFEPAPTEWMCAVVGCAVMFPWCHQRCPALNGRRSPN